MSKMTKDELQKMIRDEITAALDGQQNKDESVIMELNNNAATQTQTQPEDIYKCPACGHQRHSSFKYCPDCKAGPIEWE